MGAGFALAAALARPDSAVWILCGDGAAGCSVIEFDTFVRHGLPVIALVGNDAGWSQIAREQKKIFGDDVGTVLRHNKYDEIAEGLGVKGFFVSDSEAIDSVIDAAKTAAENGHPVLVNAVIGGTDFRKGSISM
ncbi:thiamine pyrophosphate-dependent acetolactate synthase large subunit-like protein [Desulfosalsimonas propionicica]|uniref:Thiamine pyrophosphate-dependent acetolactate synthase large subunit-like protein n=1 Tax=Desulfosalsimonas propionicica TaxID=332175 RepID=A0A7W0C5X6_9BACT|nr:thiamine pyrophosphate-dependent acetolactate synthase large subunit-like protein [Desulfosalsimonas propionicica]